MLIVDDTPTNVAVVSGVLKRLLPHESCHQRREGAGHRQRRRKARSHTARRDDARHGRLRGLPETEGHSRHAATFPIIFLTAKTEEVEEEKGFDVGAVDYIHKPFSAPIVLARVRTQLALQEALIEAQESRKQADQLLHALLPKIAADEIRSSGSVIPRRYENVAVLFCDVTNFTAYCDKHEPEDVVSRLDALFVIFERITAKHGLEKIKTIGDGFMAAAGLLHHHEDPVGSAVRCGLEMASTLIDADLGWEVRTGVHSGPVVAGVVGQERYQFDIWGDTVNVAARMVGMSAPGTVTVTREVWETMSSAFDGEASGELEIAGRGDVSA